MAALAAFLAAGGVAQRFYRIDMLLPGGVSLWWTTGALEVASNRHRLGATSWLEVDPADRGPFRATPWRADWISVSRWRVSAPWWFWPILPAGAAGLMWWLSRRVRAGQCRCGYDLQGLTPQDGLVVCPECGSRAGA
jgi:hypothetical protein